MVAREALILTLREVIVLVVVVVVLLWSWHGIGRRLGR